MLRRTLDLLRSFETIYAMEMDMNLEYEEFLQARVTEDSYKIISDLYLMGAQVKWENNGTEPAEDYTRGIQKVLGNPLLTENER
jgi:hypothetical protein